MIDDICPTASIRDVAVLVDARIGDRTLGAKVKMGRDNVLVASSAVHHCLWDVRRKRHHRLILDTRAKGLIVVVAILEARHLFIFCACLVFRLVFCAFLS